MKTPDLWLLVKSLEGKDHTRIRKFLASPYFNSDEKHVKLFEAVLEQVKEARWDREALDAIIFPYKPFSYTRITNLISDLKRLLENFFIQEELKKQTFSSEFLLMQAMQEKALPKFVGQSEERIKKQIEEDTFRTEDFYLQSFLLEDQAYKFSQIEAKGKGSDLVGKKIKSLHLFYVMAMIRAVCQDLNQRANKGTQSKTSHRFFIQYILANHQLYSHEPLLRLYILILRTLVEPANIQPLEKLTEALAATENRISRQEFWGIFTYVQANNRRSTGEQAIKTQKLLFNLYVSFMDIPDENWAIAEDFLSEEDGLEFLALSVEYQREQLSEKFISDYNLYNKANEGAQARAFYQAYFLCKVKHKRKESLKIMQAHDFDQSPFVKAAPLLLTELYYEGYEDQAIEKLWEEVKRKLKKDKRFTSTEREMYLGLKKKIQQLLKLRQQASVSRPAVFENNRRKLVEEIHSTTDSPFSSWLLRKLEQLKK